MSFGPEIKTKVIAIHYTDGEGDPGVDLFPLLDHPLTWAIKRAIRAVREEGRRIDAITPGAKEEIDRAARRGDIPHQDKEKYYTHLPRGEHQPRRCSFYDEEGVPHTVTIATKELIQATRAAYQIYGEWTPRKLTTRQSRVAKERRILLESGIGTPLWEPLKENPMYIPLLNTYAATGFGARKAQAAVTTTPVRGWDGRMDLNRAVARSLRAAERAHALPRAITPTPARDIHDAIAEGVIIPEEGSDMITRVRVSPHRVRARTRDGVPVDILAATHGIADAIAAYYAGNGEVRITRANRKRIRRAVKEGVLPPAVLRYL